MRWLGAELWRSIGETRRLRVRPGRAGIAEMGSLVVGVDSESVLGYDAQYNGTITEDI